MGTGTEWPIPGEYSNMLQNPVIAFRDPDLQKCAIERDQNNQPRPRSGAFANVYKGTYANGGDVAIRVFTRASGTDARERYAAISDYLGQLNGSKPKSLVGFAFFEKGIRVASRGGKWFPLVTMDWVPGDTLFDWVRGTCHSRNSRALGTVSEKWVELASDLNRVNIAHGDLQHGNVMVTPGGDLKLVDYDCMCVPDLVGRPNLEIGVEPYQHPERNETTLLYPGLDNFSALFILVALRALTADPQLWFAYNERANESLYDKLLFRKEDFDSPYHSALFQDLQRSPDDKVRKWADDLFGLVKQPMHDVPSLDHFVNDFEKVRELLGARAFDDALELLNRRTPPPDMQAAIQDAQQRVDQRLRLEEAIDTGDEAAMKSLYEPQLLDDYPKAKKAVETAKKAAQVIPVLDQLRKLVQTKRGRELVDLWDNRQSLLSGRKSSQAIQREVEQWRQRNTACDALLKSLRSTNPDVVAIKAQWQQLQDLGGHPDADSQQQNILQIVARCDALERFQQVPRTQNATVDQALIAAWNESLFKGWDLAERQRVRLTSAQDRVDQWQALQRSVSQHNKRLSLAGEHEIADAGSNLPDAYDAALQGRVELAARRLKAVKKFEQICRQPGAPEAELVKAWQAVRVEQAECLVDSQLQERAESAVPRAPVLQALKSISLHAPPAERDTQLLSVWNEALLDGCAEAQPWQAAYAEACQRRDLLDRLRRAIEVSDDAAIAECSESTLLAQWPFSPLEADRINKAQRAIGNARGLLNALKTGNRQAFGELFNVQAIRDFPRQFAPFQTVLRDWITHDVLPREKNGLKPPIVGKAIHAVPGSPSTFHLRWTWPAARFTEACLVKVCRSKPGEGIPADQVTATQTQIIQSKSYVSGGGRFALTARENSVGCMVVVWGIIEVGAEKFYTEPLILGRLA